MTRIVLILTIVFSLISTILKSQLITTQKRGIPPLKYIFHKNKIIRLLTIFDSISTGKHYAIGRGIADNYILINTNYQRFNKSEYVCLTDSNTKKHMDSLGINFNKVCLMYDLLKLTRTYSISTSYCGDSRAIELRIKSHLFADNYDGLVFLPEQTERREDLLTCKKINNKLFYKRHMGSPFYQ